MILRLNQQPLFKLQFHHCAILPIFAKNTTGIGFALLHKKLMSKTNTRLAKLVFSTTRVILAYATYTKLSTSVKLQLGLVWKMGKIYNTCYNFDKYMYQL